MGMKASTIIDSVQTHHFSETPAERRRRRVRDAIITAADRVFAKEGVEGLSIRRLAEEIDYSPSAIYKYFASKTELLTVLKEAFFEDLIAEIDKVKQRENQPLSECVRESVATYVQTALKRPHHYAAAFSGTDDVSDWNAEIETHDEEAPSFRMRALAMLHELVGMCVEEGLFRRDVRVALAAKSLWASMHGLAVLMIHLPGFGTRMLDDGPGMTREEFISYHSDLIIRGLEQ